MKRIFRPTHSPISLLSWHDARSSKGDQMAVVGSMKVTIMNVGRCAGGLLALLALAACDANQQPTNSIAGMQALFQLPPPRPAEFYVCHEHGCKEKTRVSLSGAEWGQVRALMSPAAANAADERARIARATALLET